LAIAIGSLPSSINLISISHITSILTVTGNATNETQILGYITTLDNSDRFGNLSIIDMTRDENESLIFTLLGTIQTQYIGISSMEIALGGLPSGLSLTAVNSDENTLTIEGLAYDEDLILIYLRTLEASGIFDEITIASMTRTEDEEMSFSLILRMRE